MLMLVLDDHDLLVHADQDDRRTIRDVVPVSGSEYKARL
jgi:hypothetical protein